MTHCDIYFTSMLDAAVDSSVYLQLTMNSFVTSSAISRPMWCSNVIYYVTCYSVDGFSLRVWLLCELSVHVSYWTLMSKSLPFALIFSFQLSPQHRKAQSGPICANVRLRNRTVCLLTPGIGQFLIRASPSAVTCSFNSQLAHLFNTCIICTFVRVHSPLCPWLPQVVIPFAVSV